MVRFAPQFSTSLTAHITSSYILKRRMKWQRLLMLMLCYWGLVHPLLAQGELMRYYHANGRLSSEGRLVDGKPEGWWRSFYEDGTIRSEGGRKGAQLDSLWRFYDPKGRLQSEMLYRDNLKNGPSRRFDTLGVLLSEEVFVNDLREGMAVYYGPGGSKHKEVPFKAGKEEGRGLEYAPDGRIIAFLNYGGGMLRRREEINRVDDRGLKQGPWKELHPNGRIRWEGSFLDDRKHGIFKEYDAQGNLKSLVKYDEGAVDTGADEKLLVEIKRTFHPNGKVASLGSYSKSGKREGLFKEFDLQGNVTTARIYNGDQLVSEGAVNDLGVMEGPWVEFFVTGEKRAEGTYKDGRKEGEWSFYHRSGKVEQKGRYMGGLPHGPWLWYYESGQVHRRENYRRGKEDGESAEYAEDGVVLTEGSYIDGRKEGKWVYEVGDHKEVGSYKDDLKDGAWTYTYGDGKRYFTGSFINGEPEGKHRWFWPNGRVKVEGRFSGGLAQGEHVHYAEDGRVIMTVRYRDGAEVRIDGERIPPPYQPGEDQP